MYMTAGLTKALRLLIAIGLLLGPLAPMSANCAPHTDIGSISGDVNHDQIVSMLTDLPCHGYCDENNQADPDSKADMGKCKVGCIAIPGLCLTSNSEPVHLPVYRAERTTTHTGWLAPPAIDPPRFTLRT